MKGYTICLVFLAQCILMTLDCASGLPLSVCAEGETSPHPTHCNLYIECSFGGHIDRECPDGLHFNNAEKVCDYPSTAGCLFEVHPQTTTSSDSSITPSVTALPTTDFDDNDDDDDDGDDDDDDDDDASVHINDCHDVDRDQFVLPHPQCDHFYLCSNGNAYESTCMGGYHWSIENNRCDLPSAAQCVDGSAPEQPGAIPAPTEETQTTLETLPPTTTEIPSTLPPRTTLKWTTTTRKPKLINFVEKKIINF